MERLFLGLTCITFLTHCHSSPVGTMTPVSSSEVAFDTSNPQISTEKPLSFPSIPVDPKVYHLETEGAPPIAKNWQITLKQPTTTETYKRSTLAEFPVSDLKASNSKTGFAFPGDISDSDDSVISADIKVPNQLQSVSESLKGGSEESTAVEDNREFSSECIGFCSTVLSGTLPSTEIPNNVETFPTDLDRNNAVPSVGGGEIQPKQKSVADEPSKDALTSRGRGLQDMVGRMRRTIPFMAPFWFNQWNNRRTEEKLGLETSDIYPTKMLKFVRELVEKAPWQDMFKQMVQMVVDNFIKEIMNKLFDKRRSLPSFGDLLPQLPLTQVVRMRRSIESNQLWHSEDFHLPVSMRKRRQECSLRNVCNAGRLLSRLPSIHELTLQLRSPGQEPYWNALLWGMEKKRCSRILCKRTRSPKGTKQSLDSFQSHREP